MRRSGVIAGVVLLALAAGAAPAAAGDKVFTVAKYPVEASAKDASTARQKALEDGQKAAFRSLLKRLVPVTAFKRIAELKKERVADLVTSYAVRTERNSDTDYVASLDFTFQPEGVRALLQRHNIPYLDDQAPATIVVPLYLAPAAAGGQALPSLAEAKGAAAWKDAWNGLDTENALAVVNLEAMKKEIHADTIKGLVGGNTGMIRILAQEYRSERVVLAVAEPDPATQKLVVTLVGQDAVGAFHLKKSYKLEGGDLGYASELAAVVSLGILEGRWKAVRAPAAVAGGPSGNPPDNGAAANPWMRPAPIDGGAPGPAGGYAAGGAGGELIHIAIEFRGMGEWQEISRALAQTPGVEELDVQGLSARGARVTLRYAEGPERLSRVLFGQGLIMRNAGRTWVLERR